MRLHSVSEPCNTARGMDCSLCKRAQLSMHTHGHRYHSCRQASMDTWAAAAALAIIYYSMLSCALLRLQYMQHGVLHPVKYLNAQLCS